MIKRFISVDSMQIDKREYEVNHVFGKSIVDKTGYHPTLDIGNSSGYVSEPIYDFADGVDTGDRTPMLCRNKGLDRTELSAMKKVAEQNVEASINRFNKKEKSEKLAQAIMSLNKNNTANGGKNESAME